jgi:hypothetical protein
MNVRVEALEMEQSLYTRASSSPSATPARTISTTSSAQPRRLAGHHHRRQDLQRPAPGLPRDGPGRRRAAPLRHPHPQDGHAVPDGADDVRDFARGLEEIFVIEEKRPFLEMFAKQVLYGSANAPRIVGKFDEEEPRAAAHYGEFESDIIVRALLKRLSRKTRSNRPKAGSSAWTRSTPQQAADRAPHRLVLLGLPAQQLDQGPRRQHRVGRHRLPHHGDVDGPQRGHGHPHGRRGRAVDRHGSPSPTPSTSSRTWATAPTPTRAAWRSATAASTNVNITFKLLVNATPR